MGASLLPRTASSGRPSMVPRLPFAVAREHSCHMRSAASSAGRRNMMRPPEATRSLGLAAPAGFTHCHFEELFGPDEDDAPYLKPPAL